MKKLLKNPLFYLVLFGFALKVALAQTPMTPPSNKKSEVKNFSKVVEQAKEQEKGNFAEMIRSSFSGGQIQSAWNDASPRDGSQTFRKCLDCVYRVRLREFMTTTIVLPNEVKIKSADLGDNSGFRVEVRDKNIIAVRPTTCGIDTNLNVYSKDGEVYSFYLRAEGHNSKNVPDLVVKIIGNPLSDMGGYFAFLEEDKKDADDNLVKTIEVADLAPPKSGDFIKNIPFNPADLHGFNDYKLWGDKELTPEMVFRDNHFTYLQFGSKWDSVELPTGYVVIDGFDELVNTRVEGNTFIIESTAKLISLKSGNKYLCLEYKGK